MQHDTFFPDLPHPPFLHTHGQKDVQEEKTEEKNQRQEARGNRKAAKAAIEAEWKEIVEKYDQAILEWSASCKRLRTEGAQARDLSKKPKHAPKPKLPVERPEDDKDN